MHEAQFFSGDYTKVKKDGKWGFIDKSGKAIGKLIYDKIYPWGFEGGSERSAAQWQMGIS